MSKHTSLTLTPEQRQQLEATVHTGQHKARALTRVRIILLLDRSQEKRYTDQEIAEGLGCATLTVANTSQYVSKMEDVLEVYQRPYDPDYPVVCFDETRKELHASPRPALAAQPGQPQRVDYEYERNGSASLLLWYEPLAGPCAVSVREQHTGVDIAAILAHLSDTV